MKAVLGTVACLLFAAGASAQCTFTVNPASISVAAEESIGSITVFGTAGCMRTASSNSSWLTVSFGNQGTGNGTVGYRVLANRDPNPRLGLLNIGGVTVTVNQRAANCTYALAPASAVVGSAGGSGSVSFQTTCNWTASANVDWIAISQPTSGTGNGSISYSVNANGTSATRTATITIGSAAFRISQPAPNCTTTINPKAANIAAAGGTGIISVTSGCGWQAASSASWITITSGTNGEGSGTVAYSVAANNTTSARTGAITVGGQTFQVMQPAASCAISINPSSATVGPEGGIANIAVTASCPWSASSSETWISILSGSGTTDGTVRYSVSANASGANRTGSILVGTQTFAVTQMAGGCSAAVSPARATLPAAGGSGSFLVTSASCQWIATNTASWLTIQPGSGNGNGVVLYTATANNSAQVRTATVQVGLQTFTLAQAAGAGPSFAAAGLLNGASFQAGPVAPGLLVTVSGTGFGPADRALAELAADGLSIKTVLAETRLLFDGVPAPMVAVEAGQLTAIVPFSVAGKDTTQVEVEYRGVKSGAVSVPVLASAPALFTADSSGSGPAAILNEDYSVNSATQPANPGSVVQLFATGGGLVDPAPSDGLLTTAAANLKLPVSIVIGGAQAEVLYAGSAPGLVAGMVQLSARIPAGVPAGPAPISILVGENLTQPFVTVFVGVSSLP